MKFEKPIAEVEKFELEDIISSSTTTTEAVTEATESAPGTTAAYFGFPCTGKQSDYDPSDDSCF